MWTTGCNSCNYYLMLIFCIQLESIWDTLFHGVHGVVYQPRHFVTFPSRWLTLLHDTITVTNVQLAFPVVLTAFHQTHAFILTPVTRLPLVFLCHYNVTYFPTQPDRDLLTEKGEQFIIGYLRFYPLKSNPLTSVFMLLECHGRICS